MRCDCGETHFSQHNLRTYFSLVLYPECPHFAKAFSTRGELSKAQKMDKFYWWIFLRTSSYLAQLLWKSNLKGEPLQSWLHNSKTIWNVQIHELYNIYIILDFRHNSLDGHPSLGRHYRKPRPPLQLPASGQLPETPAWQLLLSWFRFPGSGWFSLI